MSGRSPPVRVGVVLGGTRVPAWIAWLLDQLRAHEELTLALAVVPPAPRRQPRGRLFGLYEALDRRLFRTAPAALADTDASAALAGVAIVRGHDAAAIRRHDPDVLVVLGAGVPADGLATAARLGVWSLRSDVVADVFAGRAVVETALQMHDGAGAVDIDRSTGSTEVVSLERNRNAACWKSAGFVLRR